MKFKLRFLDASYSDGILMTIIIAPFEINFPIFGYTTVIIIFILKVNFSNNNLQLHITLYLCI